jgi:hypothetical protein
MATRKIDVNQGLKSLKLKKGRAVIVSVDGTLADTTAQQADDMNTRSYQVSIIAERAIGRVEVNDAVARRIRAYIGNHYPIIYLTPRPQNLRKLTQKWLEDNDLFARSNCYVLCREDYSNRDLTRGMKAAITFAKEYVGFAYEKDAELIKFYQDNKIDVAKIGV